MLDSDTLPVDHAGNSEGRRGRPPAWMVAAALPVLISVGVGTSHGRRGVGLAVYLGGGVVASVVVLALFALRDTRRLRVTRELQDMIEDAWTAHSKGEGQKAEQLLKESVKLSGSRLGRYDLVTLACLHTLGNLYRLRRDFPGAQSCYDQALPIYDRILPRTHPSRGTLHFHRGQNLEALKKPEEALLEGEKARLIYRTHPQEITGLANACTLVGKLRADAGDFEGALEAFSEALEALRKRYTVRDPQILRAMGYLCRIYIKLRRFQESESFLLEMLEQHRRQPDLQPEDYLEGLLDLTFLRLDQKKVGEAETLLLEALEVLQTRVGPKERPLGRILECYRRLTQSSEVGAATNTGLVNMLLTFCGERERLRQTLEKFPQWIDARDATGWGPLHWAAFVGRDDIIRWLLQRGAHMSLPEDRVSPLHVAAAWGKRECLLELVEGGGDLNSRDPRGWSPLFWCAFSGSSKLAEALIKRGADVNLRDDAGRTPLHIAAAQGHLATVAVLVGSGARLSAKEVGTGRQPLHLAAAGGHLAVCECLVYNSADLFAKDEKGKSPMEVARERHHRLLQRVLRRLSQAGLGRARLGTPSRVMLDAS